MPLSVGDVVQLTSGGQAMTVEGVREDGVIDVVWFDRSDCRRDAFEATELKLRNENDAAPVDEVLGTYK